MDARIQYTKTTDGVTIAYWVMGDDGPTLVVPPPAHPWSHIETELHIPEWRLWYELLADRYRIVRFDYRGTGLSDRRLPQSIDDYVLDMEAVVDRVAPGPDLVLFGCYFAGLIAMTYAARHPDRLSHLILWCAFAKAAETRPPEVASGFDALLQTNYEMFTNTLAHTIVGWDEGMPAHNMARYMQESIDYESLKTIWPVASDIDVTSLLPQIGTNTLLLQRKEFKFVTADMARDLASQLPNAHVSFINGDSLAPYLDDVETPLRLMEEFLADHPAAHKAEDGADEPVPGHVGAFRTIVFTDIESSTAITQQIGDHAAQDLLRRHNQIVRQALRDFGGDEIKHTGDGIMASFPAATRALEWAIAVQRAVAAHAETDPDTTFALRIGVNAGEPVSEEGDIFGTSVQLAARICDQADGWEIVVSDVVRQLTAGKSFLFAERAPVALKGFEEPIRVFDVRWRDDG